MHIRELPEILLDIQEIFLVKKKEGSNWQQFLDRNGMKGMHDVHMNQGNIGTEEWIEDNGVFQDGALLIHFTHEDKWSAIF